MKNALDRLKQNPLPIIITISLVIILLFFLFEYRISKGQIGAPLDDVYIHFQFSKNLAEGVSAYIPYVGDVDGVIQSLKEGLTNGMIYSGAKHVKDMKNVDIGIITPFGQQETKTHDLI